MEKNGEIYTTYLTFQGYSNQYKYLLYPALSCVSRIQTFAGNRHRALHPVVRLQHEVRSVWILFIIMAL